jgi:hypothetical protein
VTANTATLAAVQMTSDTDVEANVSTALALMERAADQGASYIQVPEYVTYYGSARGFADAAETIPGPTTRLFGDLARRRGVPDIRRQSLRGRPLGQVPGRPLNGLQHPPEPARPQGAGRRDHRSARG